jgi:poly-gamma-glutamate synthesis protein (capsule biosynthesis protein)
MFCLVGLAPIPASAQSAGEPRRITLAATGDLLLHGSVVRSAHAFEAEGGWSRALKGLAEAMPDEALGIINVEAPLTDSVVPLRGGGHPVLGAPPSVGAELSRAGVDVASVANNHAFDQGGEGLIATIETLDRVEIAAVGAGRTAEEALEPVVIEHHGVRVAFLAATGPMNRRCRREGPQMVVSRLRDEEALLDAIRRARLQADLVVLLLHWMWDYRTEARRYEHELAGRLIDAGADVLIGAGPHVLHPVERLASDRGDAVVAWSLGNLISGMGMRWAPGLRAPPGMHPVSVLPTTRDAVVLLLDLELSQERVRVVGLRARPLWTLNNYLEAIRDESLRHDIRVVPLREVAEPLRSLRLEVIRRDLGAEVTVEP